MPDGDSTFSFLGVKVLMLEVYYTPTLLKTTKNPFVASREGFPQVEVKRQQYSTAHSQRGRAGGRHDRRTEAQRYKAEE